MIKPTENNQHKRLIESAKNFRKDLEVIDKTILILEISDAQYMHLQLGMIKVMIDCIEKKYLNYFVLNKR